MNVLITGGNGQLARTFVEHFEQMRVHCDAVDLDRLDIADCQAVRETVKALRPNLILNCAAYNAVDKAEADPMAAYRANTIGPMLLAQAAKDIGARYVHYSSDYVFDGTKGSPYKESDAPAPLNQYGRSKLLGEEFVLHTFPSALVFRVSWVMGPGNQNFIHKLLEWSRKSSQLKIAFDEISVPTSTTTIVDFTLASLDAGLSGLYHLTNSGQCSREDWAREIFSLLGKSIDIEPVSADSFDLPARRPHFSAMSNERLSVAVGRTPRHWAEATQLHLKRYVSNP